MVECGSGALNRGKLPEQKITHRSCSSDAWKKVNVLRLLCHVGPCRGRMVIIPKRRNDNHETYYSYIGRSEEHTSELQSLMRISYAVFCLKKKTLSNITNLKTDT